MWYSAVIFCEDNIKEFEKYINKDWQIKLKLVMKAADGSHFSYEEYGLLPYYCVILIVMIALTFNTFKKFYKDYTDNLEIDLSFGLVTVGLFCHVLSILFELIDLIIFSNNG